LFGFKKVGVNPSQWMNEDILNSFLCGEMETTNNQKMHKNFGVLKKKLSKRIGELYTTEGFDLTITIHNKFDEKDLELLRNEEFSIFPFYFNKEVKRFKWIEENRDGNLEIKIKSKEKQNAIIACNLRLNQECYNLKIG